MQWWTAFVKQWLHYKRNFFQIHKKERFFVFFFIITLIEWQYFSFSALLKEVLFIIEEHFKINGREGLSRNPSLITLVREISSMKATTHQYLSASSENFKVYSIKLSSSMYIYKLIFTNKYTFRSMLSSGLWYRSKH